MEKGFVDEQLACRGLGMGLWGGGLGTSNWDATTKRGGRIMGPRGLNARARGRFPMAGGDHKFCKIFFLGLALAGVAGI